MSVIALEIERVWGLALPSLSSPSCNLLVRDEDDSRLKRLVGASEVGDGVCLGSVWAGFGPFLTPVLTKLDLRASRRLEIRVVLARRGIPSGSWLWLRWYAGLGVADSPCVPFCCAFEFPSRLAGELSFNCLSDSVRQSSVKLRHTLSALRRAFLSGGP